MEVKANLNSIINNYAEKSNTAFINFREFSIYVKKYAEQNVEKYEDLLKYIDNTAIVIQEELEELSKNHIAVLVTLGKKKIIVSLSFIAERIYSKYNEILRKSSVPYPLLENLPKSVPPQSLEVKKVEEYILSLIESEENKNEKVAENIQPIVLYVIEFSESVPSILLPSTVSLETLLTTAQRKIRKLLKKEESHDYFLKKLRNTNPTKEIPIRNLYSNFVDNEEFKYGDFTEGDAYYIWAQLLYYIRSDFDKIEDKALEDINILQSCFILETQVSYLKAKIIQKQQKEEAFLCLKATFEKSPYFYSMSQILKFKDDKGNLLCSKYSEENLQDFLAENTSEDSPSVLPPMLIFKIASGKAFYIYKRYVTQVIIKLCDEIHGAMEREIEDRWYESLLNFKKLPEMTNPEDFEDTLYTLIEEESPVLHAILTAPFMNILVSENNENSDLFNNGILPSYSELLMLYNEKIYSNAKSRLPFYYNIKIIYYIFKFCTFLASKLKSDTTTDYRGGSTGTVNNKEIKKEKEPVMDMSAKANEIAKELIPEGSDLNKELEALVPQWNQMLSKEIYNELVADVNNFIKDYVRRVIQTLSVMSFTKERAEDLAESIVNMPNMNKISDKKSLKKYVTLYIIKLVSNY